MSENAFKWFISVIAGFVATFFQQYGLFIGLVAGAVVFDFITGIVKAKATGEGLSSQKGWRGFWKKIALFVSLAFGIFLDFITATILASANVVLGVDTPFALIICCYIVLNECISIAENLYLIDPTMLPKFVIKLLKIAKDKTDRTDGK